MTSHFSDEAIRATARSVEIDLFDANGHLVDTILPSADIMDLRNATLFGKTAGVITERDGTTVSVEYKVKSVRELFD